VPKKIQNRIPDTIVVGDTSALISLGVGLVLKDCLTISKIVVPKKVQQELEEMSHFNDEDGIAAKVTLDLILNGQIEVLTVKNMEKVRALVSTNTRIDNGEAEALILAQENSIPIVITDDFRSLSKLKEVSENVEIHLSIYLLSRLVLENIITIKDAKESLERIASLRTWESGVIYRFAMKYIDDLI